MPSVLSLRNRAPARNRRRTIREFVECESPSDDPAAVNRFVDLLASNVAAIAQGEDVSRRSIRPPSALRIPTARRAKSPARFWRSAIPIPSGRSARFDTMPFRQAQGPALGTRRARHESRHRLLHVRDARAARARHRRCRAKVVLQLNSDEEVGSESSRPLTEDAARDSDAVLVLEPGTGPRRQTQDRAQRRRRLHGHGPRPAPPTPASISRAGASAIVELPRQIERIAAFTDLKRGITVNPGVISGGTRTNVVAAEARARSRHPRRPAQRTPPRWNASSARSNPSTSAARSRSPAA